MFSRTLIPFDEELSVHLRDPLNLKQFGVYYPNLYTSLKKREITDSTNDNCVGSGSRNKHRNERHISVDYIKVTSTVYLKEVDQTYAPATVDIVNNTVFSNSDPNDQIFELSKFIPTETWRRSSYYTPGSIINCTFMNHMDGTAGSRV